ncbi:hypothetical protein WH06_22690 [Aeromonas salmonicida subsp. salmonicida]|uniref:Uncharacterized protein n=4 Tax=Aeromonas salmonicida TaxID=645 RepID=A0A1Q4MCL1_AERSS|nr:hypothetical protein [Aeromonas salmonicida]ABO92572.1 conserved hypothetical protein [Aeromonas salmonicida subsp. salmonicida A449]ASD49293.1 hypothetical protein [Aeromonas salmonicida subsp. salmonicida]EHI50293.1 hypothetical protein IYQ_22500 [Aeromonas salmonicida subsp. salmonicida 01-B526]EKP0241600.1 hypothetical protein [Aeromonas salmonicida]EKP0245689.1 hypothetical protein [Aeromonas salmonicida]
MPALIPELVNMASGPRVTTSDLLRRALVAARQLKQTEWATWISYELHGYPDGVELPSYRLLKCELKAMNPMRGMIPLIIDHAEFAARLSMCRMAHSISALEALAIPGKNLRFAFSSEIVASLMHDLGISMVPERVLGANQVRALIDAVRDKLLMWLNRTWFSRHSVAEK